MEKLKIAVLLSGEGSNFQAIIDASKAGTCPVEVVLVVSNKKEAGGLVRARREGIPTEIFERGCYETKEDRDRDLLKTLKKTEAKVLVLAGYLGYLSPSILKAYPHSILNIHPSLLPSFGGKGWYGKRVHEGVYKRGVKVTGATVHFVNEETDGGPILLQEAVKIDFEDGVEDIQRKVLEVEHRLYPKALGLLAKSQVAIIEGRARILSKEEEEGAQ